MPTLRLKLALITFLTLTTLTLSLVAFLSTNSSTPTQPIATIPTKATASPTSLESLYSNSYSYLGTSSCRDNTLYNSIFTIQTVHDMLTQFGPPEKVYKWRQGGAEDLFLRYDNHYLYPTKGVNFIPPLHHDYLNPTPDSTLATSASDEISYAYLTDPQTIDPQTPLIYYCYDPADLPSYLSHFSHDDWYSSNPFGEDYVNWTTP